MSTQGHSCSNSFLSPLNHQFFILYWIIPINIYKHTIISSSKRPVSPLWAPIQFLCFPLDQSSLEELPPFLLPLFRKPTPVSLSPLSLHQNCSPRVSRHFLFLLFFLVFSRDFLVAKSNGDFFSLCLTWSADNFQQFYHSLLPETFYHLTSREDISLCPFLLSLLRWLVHISATSKCGVPQDSVLRLLLFSIFTHSLEFMVLSPVSGNDSQIYSSPDFSWL